MSIPATFRKVIFVTALSLSLGFGGYASLASSRSAEDLRQVRLELATLQEQSAAEKSELETKLQEERRQLEQLRAERDALERRYASAASEREKLLGKMVELRSVSQPAAPRQSRQLAGGWHHNGAISMNATRVEVIRDWKQLGPLIRVGQKEEALFDDIKAALEGGDYKVVTVELSMKNQSERAASLGFSTIADWGNTDSNSHHASVLFLRGEEGSEVNSGGTLRFDQGYAGSGLTYYLPGGFPKNAEVAPKGMVQGRVAFVVREWFEPAVLFTRPLYSDRLAGPGKGTELAVPLR